MTVTFSIQCSMQPRYLITQFKAIINDDLTPSPAGNGHGRKATLIKTPDAQKEATHVFISDQEASNKHERNY